MYFMSKNTNFQALNLKSNTNNLVNRFFHFFEKKKKKYLNKLILIIYFKLKIKKQKKNKHLFFK